MPDLHGTLPPAEDDPRSSRRGKVLHPFDRDEERGEKWRARNKSLTAIWPFVLGLILAMVAPVLRGLLSGVSQWAAWFAFPLVFLVERPEFGLRWDLGGDLPQIVLFLQFPLEGLWATLNLRLRGSMSFAFAPLVFLHLVGAFVLFLLVQART